MRLKILATKNRETLRTFSLSTHKWKNHARRAIYAAFGALYFSLACYGILKLKGSMVAIVLSTTSFAAAFIGIVVASYRIKSLSGNLRKKDRNYMKHDQTPNLVNETI